MHCVQNRVQIGRPQIVSNRVSPRPLPCTGVTVPARLSALAGQNQILRESPLRVRCRELSSCSVLARHGSFIAQLVRAELGAVGPRPAANLVNTATIRTSAGSRWIPDASCRELTRGHFLLISPPVIRVNVYGVNWLRGSRNEGAKSPDTTGGIPLLVANLKPKATMSAPPEVNSLLTMRQAASRITVCRRTLERLIASGKFPPPVKIGRSTRIPESDVNAFLAAKIANRGAS